MKSDLLVSKSRVPAITSWNIKDKPPLMIWDKVVF